MYINFIFKILFLIKVDYFVENNKKSLSTILTNFLKNAIMFKINVGGSFICAAELSTT